MFSRRGLLAGAVVSAVTSSAFAKVATSDFQVFDGLLHRGKPNLKVFGIRALSAVATIWRHGVSQSEVDDRGIETAMEAVPSEAQLLFLDIEAWPLLHVSTAERDSSIAKIIHVASTVRRLRPALAFGFYGFPPATTYWPLASDQFQAQYDEWLDTNKALKPVAKLVDVLFPSLYTFYDDHQGWLRYASATLEAAKEYGRPVYPFLWFEYHDSNPQLRDKEIDAIAWRDELRFCRAHADGIVLWGGYGRRWSDEATWWQVARAELRLNAR